MDHVPRRHHQGMGLVDRPTVLVTDAAKSTPRPRVSEQQQIRPVEGRQRTAPEAALVGVHCRSQGQGPGSAVLGTRHQWTGSTAQSSIAESPRIGDPLPAPTRTTSVLHDPWQAGLVGLDKTWLLQVHERDGHLLRTPHTGRSPINGQRPGDFVKPV